MSKSDLQLAGTLATTLLATSCAGNVGARVRSSIGPEACTVTLTHTDGAGTFEGDYTYDANGRLIGGHPHVYYAASGWLEVEHGANAAPVHVEVRHVADEMRDRPRSVETAHHWFDIEYDRAGRLRTFDVRGETADGRSVAYRHARYRFDRTDRLVAKRFRSAPRGRTRRIRFRYGRSGLTAVIRRNETTTFERDAAGRVTAMVSASGRRTFDHDEGGRLLTDTNGTRVQSWRYDPSGRLLSYRRVDGDRSWETTFTYDERGRWVGSSDASGADVTTVEYEGQCDAAVTAPRAPTVVELAGAAGCVHVWPAKPSWICDGAFTPVGGIVGR